MSRCSDNASHQVCRGWAGSCRRNGMDPVAGPGMAGLLQSLTEGGQPQFAVAWDDRHPGAWAASSSSEQPRILGPLGLRHRSGEGVILVR